MENETITLPMVMKLTHPLTPWQQFESCDELKSLGVFVSGKFNQLDSNYMYCKGWESICETGWMLFDEYCVRLSTIGTYYNLG